MEGQGASQLILVADDDAPIRKLTERVLTAEGYRVVTASDGKMALELVHKLHPDLVILDVVMPELSGVEVIHRLADGFVTRDIPVVVVTASAASADKVLAFTTGADDYMLKPFDAVELVARVKSTLRRLDRTRELNPLTRLPGNNRIQQEIAKRIAERTPFALLYADLDNFKPYNDHYGFLRGDAAIRSLAVALSEAVRLHGGERAFVGHIGGDDFAAVTTPEGAEQTAQETIRRWDDSVPALYDEVDLARGYIEVLDRRNEPQRFPLGAVSIGIVSNEHRSFVSHLEAAEVAGEMKEHAKRRPGSSYSRDRRSEAPQTEAAPEGGASTGPVEYMPEPSGVVLLYIDDDDASRRLLVGVLARHRPDYVVHTASTGDEGLEVAQREDPDVVLLDVHLPDRSGEEVLADLVRDGGPAVAMLTGEVDEEMSDRLTEMGASAYVTKPYDVVELVSLIGELARGRKRH